MTGLLSPATGLELRMDTAHSLSDGVARWPVIDGIAFLRVGRERLVAACLAALDRGSREQALMLLLADQDEWWQGETPRADDLRRLTRETSRLSLREAMRLLAWGPVATYFAHRWSDPTFLGALGLIEAHWNAPATAFELACGIGHHLRELDLRHVRVGGGDVVFAKLWVARHWIVPRAELICFDASAPWPIQDLRYESVSCHDAFYFLEPKPEVLQRLRQIADDGLLTISHVHNRDQPNLSPGRPVTAGAFAALFPDGYLYDDAETLAALIEARAPSPAAAPLLRRAEAFSVAAGPGVRAPRPVLGGLAIPPQDRVLRRNPLYENNVVRWPSERYAQEYGGRATFPLRTDCPPSARSRDASRQSVLRRELVDLPERW